MNRYLGDPPGARKVYPLPDMEPVEFPAVRAVRADWITDDMVRELEAGE